MAQYTRIEVAAIMKETGMVPLFYHSDIALGKKVLKACYDGGARLMEFTARGDFAFEVFSALNKFAVKELPGMILGVGSITDAAAASLYMQMGANFIITPSLISRIYLWPFLCKGHKRPTTLDKYYAHWRCHNRSFQLKSMVRCRRNLCRTGFSTYQ